MAEKHRQLRDPESAPAEWTDDDLMAKAGFGDERAFAVIVRRHYDPLKTLALRFSGFEAEAEDVVQETFVAAWRAAPDWKPARAQLSTWLYRVAMNRCIDRSRRIKRWRPVSFEDSPDPHDRSPDQENRLHWVKAVEKARDAILQLPARQRAAILLAADGGRSNKDIADILGTGTGAVEQLLVRARRTLRIALGAEMEV